MSAALSKVLKLRRTFVGLSWFIKWSNCTNRRSIFTRGLDSIPGRNHIWGNSRCFSAKQQLINLESPSLLRHINALMAANLDDALHSESVIQHPLTDLMKKRMELLDNIKNLVAFKSGNLNDGELQKLAQEEYSMYQTELVSLDEQILNVLVPPPKYDHCNNIVLEVQSGAGGQEAMLFAAELFQLYEKYSVSNGWQFFIDNFDRSSLGGIKSAVAFVSGQGAFYYMQNEIGVHRVQRIPYTERTGRIHTSTAAVIVMPEPTEVDIKLHDKDLQYEYMCAGGPGGQHVNKVETAVRLKHLPTGVFVESSSSRHQYENKQTALKKLRLKLYKIEEEKQTREIQLARQSQLGNRDRSEKIRTYNFQQDRITDHRINFSVHNIKSYMEGGGNFQLLLDKLNEFNRIKQLNDFCAKLDN